MTATNAYRNTRGETGTLVGNAASIAGGVFNAVTVVFDQGADATIARTIAGFGGNADLLPARA